MFSKMVLKTVEGGDFVRDSPKAGRMKRERVEGIKFFNHLIKIQKSEHFSVLEQDNMMIPGMKLDVDHFTATCSPLFR